MKRSIQIGLSIWLSLILLALLLVPALMSLDGRPTSKQKLLRLLHNLVLVVQLAIAIILVACPPFRTAISIFGLLKESDLQAQICSRRC